MGFVYDNNITIPNNKTDGNLPSIPTQWVAADANLHANALLDVRTAIQGGDYFALRDMSGGLPDVSSSGAVKLLSNAGVAQVSSNGAAYRNLFPAFTTETASFTLGAATYVACNATGGSIVATLPTASAANSGVTYTVYKSDVSVNTVTLGSTTLASQYDSATVLSTGAAWVPLASESGGSLAFAVNIQTQFGVVADGVTDDTAAIQAALDFGYTEINTYQRPCELVFPPGIMLITSTLVWKGNSAATPALSGCVPTGSSFDVASSCTLKWGGANNGTMMYAQKCNNGVMQDLKFNGNNKAGICLHLAAALYADRETLAATNGIRVNRCAFSYVKIATVGNGCLALGSDDHPGHPGETWQQADGRFDNCHFEGESTGAPGFTFAGMKAYGVKMLQGGNCKLFSFNYCNWNTCDIALDAGESSGPLNVLIAEMGNVRQAFNHNTGALTVIGGDIECADVDDFVLLTGSGSPNCTHYLDGLEVAGFMAGAMGTLISTSGALTLKNSYLTNNNTSVSAPKPNPFKIIAGGTTVTPGVSFRSENNWYRCPNATGYVPVYDGSTNPVWPDSGSYGWNQSLTVTSSGDSGGVESPTGSDLASLTAFNSEFTQLFSTFTNSVQFGYEESDPDISSTISQRTFQVVDVSGGSKTLTLPAAATNLGRNIWVSKSDSGSNTLTCEGLVLRSQHETAQFVSNGTSWVLFGIPLNGLAQRIDGAKTFSAPIIHSETGSITAHSGGGQGSATALTTDVNVVGTVAVANDSVKLPTAIAGMEILVFNQGANPLDIFPVSGGSIDALGANTAYSLAATASRLFVGVSSTAWLSR